MRDREGRLISFEQRTRRVTRTEHDGRITVMADNYEGKKKLISRNGVVAKADNTV